MKNRRREILSTSRRLGTNYLTDICGAGFDLVAQAHGVGGEKSGLARARRISEHDHVHPSNASGQCGRWCNRLSSARWQRIGANLNAACAERAHIGYSSEIVTSRGFGARTKNGYIKVITLEFGPNDDMGCELHGHLVRHNESYRPAGIITIRSFRAMRILHVLENTCRKS